MENSSIALVDLAKEKCQSFTFTVDPGPKRSVIEKIGLKPPARIPVSFYQMYEKETKKHLMRVRLVPKMKADGDITVSVIYSVIENTHVPMFLRQVTGNTPALEQFAKLCLSDMNFLFRCEAIFVKKRDENEFFPLPIKFPTQTATFSFDEVRGMRLVKVKDGKILIENYIDLVDDSTISQTVKFVYESKFMYDLPLTLLQESKKLIL
jgi:hypothetical protein